MNHEPQDRDQELIRLLGKLKQAGPEYPDHLRARRRAAILAGLVAIPVATGLVGASWFVHLAKVVKGMAIVDKIILGVELVAITGLTTYGAVTAYIYRDALKQLIFPSSNTPFPTLSVPPTDTSIPPTQIGGTRTPTPTGTLTVTVPPLFTVTEIGSTPVPGLPTNPPPPTRQPEPTNRPRPTPTHGLHLGQTKTPRP